MYQEVIPTAQSKFTIAPLLKVPPASRGEPRLGLRFPASQGEPSNAPVRFPLLSGGTSRRGSSITPIFTNFGSAVGKCLCVGFSTCPPPNLPRGRGRSHGSLPARGEGWGGGYVEISLQRRLLEVRAKKRARPAHSELKRCTLTPLSPSPAGRGRGNAQFPSPTAWERGWG